MLGIIDRKRNKEAKDGAAVLRLPLLQGRKAGHTTGRRAENVPSGGVVQAKPSQRVNMVGARCSGTGRLAALGARPPPAVLRGRPQAALLRERWAASVAAVRSWHGGTAMGRATWYTGALALSVAGGQSRWRAAARSARRRCPAGPRGPGPVAAPGGPRLTPACQPPGGVRWPAAVARARWVGSGMPVGAAIGFVSMWQLMRSRRQTATPPLPGGQATPSYHPPSPLTGGFAAERYA
jgi:hypothetical protein